MENLNKEASQEDTGEESVQDSTTELNNEPLTQSEEETQETRDSNDDTSKDSKEAKSKEEPSEEEKKEETFYNAQTVPEELKPTFKRMQGAFTKKMQSVAEQRDKVEAFDKLMENSKFRQMMGYEEAPQPLEDKYKGKSAMEIVQSMVQESLSKTFDEKVTPMQQEFEEQRAAQEIEQLRQKYPGDKTTGEPSFDELREDIADRVEKDPGTPMEDHYKAVAYDIMKETAFKAGKTALQEKQEQKEKASPIIAGAPSSVTGANSKINSFDDAVRVAKQKLGLSK